MEERDVTSCGGPHKSNTKKEGIIHIRAKLEECLKKNWEGTVMHGRCIISADRQLIGGADRLVWR